MHLKYRLTTILVFLTFGCSQLNSVILRTTNQSFMKPAFCTFRQWLSGCFPIEAHCVHRHKDIVQEIPESLTGCDALQKQTVTSLEVLQSPEPRLHLYM